MSELTFTLPMPANIGNGSHGSWHGRSAQKKRYHAALDLWQSSGLIPPPPRKPFAKARIATTMYLWNAMDDDNAMRRHKWVLDWLKTRGYIANDSRKHLQWAGLPEQVVTRDPSRANRLAVVLREVA